MFFFEKIQFDWDRNRVKYWRPANVLYYYIIIHDDWGSCAVYKEAYWYKLTTFLTPMKILEPPFLYFKPGGALRKNAFCCSFYHRVMEMLLILDQGWPRKKNMWTQKKTYWADFFSKNTWVFSNPVFDGNSEHDAQAWVKIGLFVEKNIRFVATLDLVKCLKQIK